MIKYMVLYNCIYLSLDMVMDFWINVEYDVNHFYPVHDMICDCEHSSGPCILIKLEYDITIMSTL